ELLPLRNSLNEIVRTAYVRDCEIGVKRWNRLLEKAGVAERVTLPSPRFRRGIGAWAGLPVDPEGRLLDAPAWERRNSAWLPSADDRAFVQSLMQGVTAPGKIAAWIAPLDRGVNNLPVDYEYVRLA